MIVTVKHCFLTPKLYYRSLSFSSVKMSKRTNINNNITRMPFLQFLTGEDEPISDVKLGIHGFVEYIPGNTNLIISVPHGGEMRPPFMDDRDKKPKTTKSTVVPPPGIDKDNKNTNVGDDESKVLIKESLEDDTNSKISVVADIFTQEIAKIMVKEYEENTGMRPHLILDHLHRCKMDPNRPIQYAALGDKLAEGVFKNYHNFISEAKRNIDGCGLLIDLHGQNHHQNSIEIGYLYSRGMLNQEDYSLVTPSVSSLLMRHQLKPQDILHGAGSLGGLMEKAGYRACPSPRQPSPGEDKYYKGGYITQTHGSASGGEVDAIQLELPSELRHERGPELREKFARDCARVLASFMEKYYACDNSNVISSKETESTSLV